MEAEHVDFGNKRLEHMKRARYQHLQQTSSALSKVSKAADKEKSGEDVDGKHSDDGKSPHSAAKLHKKTSQASAKRGDAALQKATPQHMSLPERERRLSLPATNAKAPLVKTLSTPAAQSSTPAAAPATSLPAQAQAHVASAPSSALPDVAGAPKAAHVHGTVEGELERERPRPGSRRDDHMAHALAPVGPQTVAFFQDMQRSTQANELPQDAALPAASNARSRVPPHAPVQPGVGGASAHAPGLEDLAEEEGEGEEPGDKLDSGEDQEARKSRRRHRARQLRDVSPPPWDEWARDLGNIMAPAGKRTGRVYCLLEFVRCV